MKTNKQLIFTKEATQAAFELLVFGIDNAKKFFKGSVPWIKLFTLKQRMNQIQYTHPDITAEMFLYMLEYDTYAPFCYELIKACYKNQVALGNLSIEETKLFLHRMASYLFDSSFVKEAEDKDFEPCITLDSLRPIYIEKTNNEK
jgi:hypothetical protein